MTLKLLVFIHILGACIWVGGHLILIFRYLPQALKNKDVALINDYESKYEWLGIPALLTQIITGIWIGNLYDLQFLHFGNHRNLVFNLKLITLVATLLLALHARISIIPKLKASNLSFLALHILLVSLLALTFVYLGVSFRL